MASSDQPSHHTVAERKNPLTSSTSTAGSCQMLGASASLMSKLISEGMNLGYGATNR